MEKYARKLKFLMHIIVCWYSSDCLKDEDCLQSLISICHKFWPIGTDAELQIVFMKMLLFISDNSLPGKWMRMAESRFAFVDFYCNTNSFLFLLHPIQHAKQSLLKHRLALVQRPSCIPLSSIVWLRRRNQNLSMQACKCYIWL